MEGDGARLDEEGLGKLIRKAVGDELDERGVGKGKEKAGAGRKIFDW
jgi:hypothetical protein